MKLAIMISIIILLSGCSNKEYVYVEPKPFIFKTIEQPKSRTIRIYNEDIILYKNYIKNFREIIDFYNLQILDYNNSFNKGE